jgi:hypothetical protein
LGGVTIATIELVVSQDKGIETELVDDLSDQRRFGEKVR